MKNMIATGCTTACSLGIAGRWALAGLGIASVVLGLILMA